jgi:hypothetical protein
MAFKRTAVRYPASTKQLGGGRLSSALAGMDSTHRNLHLLQEHMDLLPLDRQVPARWLCEQWRGGDTKLPRWLRRRISSSFNYNLLLPSAPTWLARELALQLLATSKFAIAQRMQRAVHGD